MWEGDIIEQSEIPTGSEGSSLVHEGIGMKVCEITVLFICGFILHIRQEQMYLQLLREVFAQRLLALPSAQQVKSRYLY